MSRTTYFAGLRPVPKPDKRIESSGFLAFVRQKPCCVCSAPAPSDPHHFGSRGIGRKTDDLRCVPLCRKHHDEFHDKGLVLSLGPERVHTERHFFRAQVDLLVEWIRRCVRRAGDAL